MYLNYIVSALAVLVVHRLHGINKSSCSVEEATSYFSQILSIPKVPSSIKYSAEIQPYLTNGYIT